MKKNAKKYKKNRLFVKAYSKAYLVPKFLDFRGFLGFFILHELSKKPLSGDGLAAAIGSRKGAVLTPGTIYPALKRLRLQKLIQYKRDGRKKVYVLTDLGIKELKASYLSIKTLFSGIKTKINRNI